MTNQMLLLFVGWRLESGGGRLCVAKALCKLFLSRDLVVLSRLGPGENAGSPSNMSFNSDHCSRGFIVVCSWPG